jgi:hypothetical protein
MFATRKLLSQSTEFDELKATPSRPGAAGFGELRGYLITGQCMGSIRFTVCIVQAMFGWGYRPCASSIRRAVVMLA